MIYRPDRVLLRENIYLDGGARLIAQAGFTYKRENLHGAGVGDEAIEAAREKEMVTAYYIGVSLGGPGSPSGVALVEREAERLENGALANASYRVRGLKSHSADETYLSLGRDVAARAEKSPGGGGACNIVLDWTDVGNATASDVGNLLPKRSILACVRIRPDAPPTRDDLISKTVSLFEREVLEVDAGLITRLRFDHALRSFTRRKPGLGSDPFALKERAGDELVVATLVALFYASHVNSFNPPRWL